jgi:5'-nucleotidase
MITRREFLRRSGAGLALFGLGSLVGELAGWRRDAWAAPPPPGDAASGGTVVTILHTNDVHSRIDPFPEDGGRNAGLGGAARRATLIKRIRAENPHTLVVDAGDAFQGTPYFNLFKGEVDFRVMSALGYDAMNIGNHDFDGGLDGLANAAQFAEFELLSANYDFSRTVLAGRVKPYIVRKLGDIRVGIFGLGTGLDGLVSDKLRLGVGYTDPAPVAQRMVDQLRVNERCPLVICVSHLGNEGYEGEPGDHELVRSVEGIDLIVGGHSHTFMETPSRVRNGDRETIIHQVGFGGLYLGRVDFHIAQGQVTRARVTALPVDDSLVESEIGLPAAS